MAFTFPVEARQEVENIVMDLGNRIGRKSIFYDNYYKSQFARPNLDLSLQDIYRDRSDFIVVFLCEHYQQTECCNLEFRAIFVTLVTTSYLHLSNPNCNANLKLANKHFISKIFTIFSKLKIVYNPSKYSYFVDSTLCIPITHSTCVGVTI